MSSKSLSVAVLLCGAAAGLPAATLIGQDPPSNVIVYAGGLEWVYAAPCAPNGCGTITLHHGFRLPTNSEWLSSFADLNDLYTQFSTPSQKCAAPYFSNQYDHCDFVDVSGGYVYDSPFAPDDYHRFNDYADTFLVRGEGSQIPEPQAWLLIGSGLAGLALLGRRRRGRAGSARR